MKKRILTALIAVGLLAFAATGVHDVVHTHQKVQLQNVQLMSKDAQIRQLQVQYKILNNNLDTELKQKSVNEEKVKQLEQQKQDLDKKAQELQAQLQARARQKSVAGAVNGIASAVVPRASAATTSGCVTGYTSGDFYLDKIIAYESSGNSCATNPGGCFGLLQACPGQPLRDACGGNPSCQIAWFQQYKTGGRSWAEVWQHELTYGWW